MEIPPAVWLLDFVNSAPVISHTGAVYKGEEEGEEGKEGKGGKGRGWELNTKCMSCSLPLGF